ncbi:MAG: DUF6290 family protein [Bacillota bacterium]|nr:DUF6290 family protein [Bacillota bacterium]
MSISIRMTKEQEQLAKSYAQLKGMTLSEAIKKVYFEAIEDEFDIAIADERMVAIDEGKEKTISWEEVQKNNGLL